MNSVTKPPRMSAIVLAPTGFKDVATAIDALARQDEASDIELVLVTGQTDLPVPDGTVEQFHSWRLLRLPDWRSSAHARVAAVHAATAPIVAFVEDHCYPVPGWARSLLNAHTEDWAAVGPAMLNGNPSTTVSWANFLIEYGPWAAPVARGAHPHIPGHNSSYKRAVLLDYSPEGLRPLMEAESVLHWDLQRRGHHVGIEPAAQTRHMNFSDFSASRSLRYQGGRLFAASRARQWPLARRILYAGGSVILPVLRTWRTIQHARRMKRTSPLATLVATSLVLLAFDAAGEAMGYAFGPGRSAELLLDMEFERWRFMRPAERHLVGA